ncbi:MAG TPA: protein-glutamate O-methyltransferase CheR [Myxococcaceae bacterium]|nr:protein-glutamate O-methyltransferase CheR [Myxococcaceae bacterium]
MPPINEPRPEMSPEEFRLLRELVYEHCGIRFREDMKFMVEGRLWPRLEAAGVRDFSAYYRLLRLGVSRKEELEAAVEAVSTKETYFFREPVQLRAFSDEVLPILRERNAHTRRLRLWSAGCSTGEEAYTLAMLVHESGLFTGWDVEVLGTDISKRVLGAARAAEYGPGSFRATSADLKARYFEPTSDPKVLRVREEIRALVSFGHLNLMDADASSLVARNDAIFCRNVMIYFDLAARKRVLRAFYDKLSEGGYLLLGHSESLLNLSTDFELVHLKEDLIYRRPTRGQQEPRS